MPCLAAMSGGVDSSAALCLARRMYGEETEGVTLTLAPPHPGTPEEEKAAEADRQNVRDAAAVCAAQGKAHRVLDAHVPFRAQVMQYFTEEYLAGRTPNPCVVCNRAIKFGLLGDYAAENGFDTLVTGHYARQKTIGDYTYIRQAADLSKDQSYVLAMLTQEQIRHAAFPLGEYSKPDIRAIAAEAGLPTAQRRDSQDICFIPDSGSGAYVAFLERMTGQKPVPGAYISETGEILGQHRGYWCYTIGQHKRLGISMGHPVFVLAKDAVRNRITLGEEERLWKKRVTVGHLHFPADPAILDTDRTCRVKLRYSAAPAEAVFHRTGETEGLLELSEPQRAPTPGQFAVFYREDCVIAGAVIR